MLKMSQASWREQRSATAASRERPRKLRARAAVADLLSRDDAWLIFNTHGLDSEGWGPIRADYLDRLLARFLSAGVTVPPRRRGPLPLRPLTVTQPSPSAPTLCRVPSTSGRGEGVEGSHRCSQSTASQRRTEGSCNSPVALFPTLCRIRATSGRGERGEGASRQAGAVKRLRSQP